MKKPIFAAFASPKGGVGKTTLTILTASNLHYAKQLQVAVVDCNYPLYPIDHLRRCETLRAKLLTQYQKTEQRAYPILNTTVANALQSARALCEQEPSIDLVLFDLPALTTADGVSELLSAMDLVFFPVTDSVLSASTTERYIEVLNEQVVTMGRSNIKAIYLLANMVNPWAVEHARRICRELFDTTGVSLMTTSLSYTREALPGDFEANRRVGMSTLQPTGGGCRRLRAKELVSEISKIIEELCGNS